MQCIELYMLVTHQQRISFNRPAFLGDFRGTFHPHPLPTTEEPEELKRIYLAEAGLIYIPELFSFSFLLKITKLDRFFS